MSDIVKQLLFRSSDEAGIGWTPTTVVHVPAGLLHQAADEITRLTAEVERLCGFETANRLNAAQVKAQRARVEELERARGQLATDLITERDALAARVAELEGVLKWYADKGNYKRRSYPNEDCFYPALIEYDEGEKARAALSQPKETTDE
jgi:FtsZ-binding cell division protein ZapB